MGLDIDLVKFSKADYDHLANDRRKIDYSAGRFLGTGLFYWRKHAEIREVLVDLCDGESQCDFHELTKEMLEAARARATSDEVWYRPEHMAKLVAAIDKILAETDFEKEVISLSWIS
jgi:hypothetical protein